MSFVLDDHHLPAAARYVEMNPVRAGLVARPRAYPWSSASAHLKGRDDVLLKSAPLLTIVGNRRKFLSQHAAEETAPTLRRHERTGRPLGDDRFLAKLEGLLHRVLKPKKPGRKSKMRPK